MPPTPIGRPSQTLHGSLTGGRVRPDAAHIEAKDYDKIGKEESELAIELAKELLKAVYQYTSLVQRLTALNKAKPT
ncbi:putative DNA-binding protein HMt-1.1 [Aminobacter niigataensis]|nr:putative DNA-binding protein HMt-1.1 [Aminobacter niigataensis]